MASGRGRNLRTQRLRRDEVLSEPASRASRIARVGLALAGVHAFALIALLAYAPTRFPATGLDPSWGLAVTEAATRGLVFGRDIVFTYGPLGYLVAGAATPATFYAIAWFRIGIALLAAAFVFALARAGLSPARQVAFVTAVGFALAAAQGRTSMLVILLVALAIVRLAPNRLRRAPYALVLGVLAGLLGLTKFTYALDFIAALGLALGVNGAFPLLVVFLASLGAVSAVSFAVLSYGAVAAILTYAVALLGLATAVAIAERRSFAAPRARIALALGAAAALALVLAPAYRAFVAGSLEVTLGYSSAMTIPGPPEQLALALVVFGALALTAFLNRATLGAGGALGIVALAWLLFKEGFVRQDNAHVFQFFAGAPLVFAAMLPAALLARAQSIALAGYGIALVAFVWATSLMGADPWFVDALLPDALTAKVAAMTGVAQPPPPQTDLRTALAGDVLAADDRARIATLPVDVQPWETALVFANGFRWAPEPVFQSYSAYTADLDRRNAEDLLAVPRRVLLAFEAIDGRAFFAESPLARRALLCDYALDPQFGARAVASARGDRYLVLTPHAGGCGPATAAGFATAAWGARFPIPRARPGEAIFASFDVRSSAAGRIARLAFRGTPVVLTFVRADGSRTVRRIVPEVHAAPFLVDPAPRDLAEAARLWEGRLPSTVRALALGTDDPGAFAATTRVTFERVRLAGGAGGSVRSP